MDIPLGEGQLPGLLRMESQNPKSRYSDDGGPTHTNPPSSIRRKNGSTSDKVFNNQSGEIYTGKARERTCLDLEFRCWKPRRQAFLGWATHTGTLTSYGIYLFQPSCPTRAATSPPMSPPVEPYHETRTRRTQPRVALIRWFLSLIVFVSRFFPNRY